MGNGMSFCCRDGRRQRWGEAKIFMDRKTPHCIRFFQLRRTSVSKHYRKILALPYCSRPIVSKQNGMALFFFLACNSKNTRQQKKNHSRWLNCTAYISKMQISGHIKQDCHADKWTHQTRPAKLSCRNVLEEGTCTTGHIKHVAI